MSVLNLVKVGAICFAVGAAIGGGISAALVVRNVNRANKAEKPNVKVDPVEQTIREAAEKMGATVVELEVTRK